MKTPIRLFEIIFALLCLALLPNAQAVNPPPDGGYPGFNTAEGQNAMFSLTTGVGNAAVGWYSLFSNTDGSFNTALGAGTLLFNVGDQSTGEGVQNTAVGTAALLFNTTGSDNSAFGVAALVNNTEGDVNTATGAFALQANTTGTFNTASGAQALVGNTTGNFNTAIGYNTLPNNGTGVNNTAIGAGALFSNSTGGQNTALGESAGLNLTTGNGNVCIGAGAIGVAGESNTTRIRNIGSTAIVGGINVVIESTGAEGAARLGYASSSRRYKQEIKPMENASERVFALKPVTFRSKGDADGAARVKHYGLIAEEVATVDPDLVVFNPEGKPETLRFDSINAMLLNEFLKEHRKAEQQEATVAQLKSTVAKQGQTIAQQQEEFQARIVRQESEIRALIAIVKEQAAQIQKVSAHMELNRSAARALAENP